MLKLAICDDDIQICSIIESYLLDISHHLHFKLDCDIYYNGDRLYSALKNDKYDLIFLDIELKDTSGILLGKYIREDLKDDITQIVYISGKSSYAMELFQIRPLNFLQKPILKEELLNVMKTVLRILKCKIETFELKLNNSLVRLSYNDIIYFESCGRKVTVHTGTNNYSFYNKLDTIWSTVKNFNYLYIHKSYIVNQLHISEYHYDKLTLTNGQTLPISQNRRPDIRAILINEILENKL